MASVEGPLVPLKRTRGQHGRMINKSSLGLNPKRNPMRRCPAPGCQAKLYAFTGSFANDGEGRLVPVSNASHKTTGGKTKKQGAGKQHDFNKCHCPDHQLFFYRPPGQPLGKECDQVCCYGCGNYWKFVSEGGEPRRDYNSNCTCIKETRDNPWAGAPGPTRDSETTNIAAQLHHAMLTGMFAFACASTAVSALSHSVPPATKQEDEQDNHPAPSENPPQDDAMEIEPAERDDGRGPFSPCSLNSLDLDGLDSCLDGGDTGMMIPALAIPDAPLEEDLVDASSLFDPDLPSLFDPTSLADIYDGTGLQQMSGDAAQNNTGDHGASLLDLYDFDTEDFSIVADMEVDEPSAMLA